MKVGYEQFGEAPQKGELEGPFCRIGNEVFDVFLPIMGAECLTVYSHFKRIEFTNPKLTHSIRGIAEATGLGEATVSRSLEILEHLGLIKLSRFGGNRDSECQLLDSRAVALGIGAQYQRKTVSYSLLPQVKLKLIAQVKALREKQQGKSSPKALPGASPAYGNLPFRVSQRNAGVSSEKRQRATRETQMGNHLLQEERRTEEVLSPTPSLGGEAQNAKDSPNESKDSTGENEPNPTHWATELFTGVMKDFSSHLLNTSRPPVSHLANGADDWEKFGFNTLAVEAATRQGNEWALVLSARDPAAARSGLEKYRRKWDESLQKWLGCKVYCELRDTISEQRPNAKK